MLNLIHSRNKKETFEAFVKQRLKLSFQKIKRSNVPRLLASEVTIEFSSRQRVNSDHSVIARWLLLSEDHPEETEQK